MTDICQIATLADLLFPGIVVQKSLTNAIAAWLADNDGVLAEADVPAVLALANTLAAAETLTVYVPTTQPPYPSTLPPYPTGLLRFPDSNPTPAGWSIVTDEKVVRGGRL